MRRDANAIGSATTAAIAPNGAAPAGVVKAGNGTLQLAAANTYSAATTVNAGTLAVANASALGASSQGTIVNSNAVLALRGVTVSDETLALTAATLQADAGSNAWTSNIVITNTCFFLVASNATLNLPGALSGPGAATKIGDGTLVFSGAATNGYSGVTAVNQVGFVVRDLDKAMAAYWRVGVGPWRVYTYGAPLVKDITYRGKPGNWRFLQPPSIPCAGKNRRSCAGCWRQPQ